MKRAHLFNNAVQIFSLFALVTLTWSCAGSGSNGATQSGGGGRLAPADEVSLISKVPVAADYAHPLVEYVRTEKPVPRELLVDSVLELQGLGSKERSVSELQIIDIKDLASEAKQASKGAVPPKETYEKIMQSWQTDSIGYDVSNVSIFDALLEGNIQCYSGTVLNLVMELLSISGPEFQKRNKVVLFEDGHVLPGEVLKETNGRYRLKGIETTVSTRPVIDYGYTDQLDQHPRVKEKGLRVVFAVDFLVSEVIEPMFEKGKELDLYVQSVLSGTASPFQIPWKKLEAIIAERKLPSVRDPMSGVVNLAERTGSDPLNESVFAFGTADVTPGRKDRQPGTGFAEGESLPQLEKESEPSPSLPSAFMMPRYMNPMGVMVNESEIRTLHPELVGKLGAERLRSLAILMASVVPDYRAPMGDDESSRASRSALIKAVLSNSLIEFKELPGDTIGILELLDDISEVIHSVNSDQDRKTSSFKRSGSSELDLSRSRVQEMFIYFPGNLPEAVGKPVPSERVMIHVDVLRQRILESSELPH